MGAVNAEAVVVRQLTAEATIVGNRVASAEFVRGSVRRVPLTITENGTYTAPVGQAYSPVVANVADSLPWASDEGGGF